MTDERTDPPLGAHRDRVPLRRQGFGVYAAPAAWAVQFLIGYGLTAYACHPGRLALAHVAEGWAWTRPGALIVNLAAALVALAGGLVSLATWRASRGETEGVSATVLEAGEGRTRFLGAWGALTSFGFLVAILFDTVMIVGAPACHG